MKRILGIASAMLFVLAAWRVYHLSITWDEALSFLEYMQLSPDAKARENTNLANHHLLNSWLGSISYLLLGAEEWKLRLPSLLFYALYLWTALQIAMKMPSVLLSICAFVMFHFSSYQNDFFCLARGYGMAMSAGTFSVYMLYRFAETRKNIFLFSHLLAAICSTLCSFTWAYFLLLSFAVSSYLWWIQPTKKIGQGIWVILFCLLYTVLAGFRFVLLKKTGSLYFGGQPNEMWMRMVQGLVDLRMGFIGETLLSDLTKQFLLVFILLLTAVSFAIVLMRDRALQQSPLAVLSVFFIPVLLAHVLHVFVLGSLTFCDRTWTALYPLITLALIGSCAALHARTALAGNMLGVALSLLLITGFAGMFAPEQVYEWRDEKDCKQVLCNNRQLFSGTQLASVGIDFCFEPQLEYYRMLWNMNYMPPNKNAGLQPYQDYYLINRNRTKAQEQWEALECMPGSGIWLYKNKQPFSLIPITESKPQLFDAAGNLLPGARSSSTAADRAEFITSADEPYGKACVLKFAADSGAFYRVTGTLMMKNSFPGNDGQWIIDVGQGNKQLLYTGTHMKSLAPVDDTMHSVTLNYTFGAESSDSILVKCYPLNHGRHAMIASDFSIKLYRIQAN